MYLIRQSMTFHTTLGFAKTLTSTKWLFTTHHIRTIDTVNDHFVASLHATMTWTRDIPSISLNL